MQTTPFGHSASFSAGQLCWVMGLILCTTHLAAEVDFNRDIRPILAENCFYCHGQDGNKRQADLRLDIRQVAIDSGAITPGVLEASELIARIASHEPDTMMPPPDSNRSLSDSQREQLGKWIAEGAEYQQHWAFVAPHRPQPPVVQQLDWPRGTIDYFVLAKLEAEHLTPSAEADRITLIRRLHADLIGLPPTPAQVDLFVHDPDPLAYEKLVDQLLESRHYGERLALPWLDAARYADSNGFQQDGDTWQWIWRDWVVRALNDNLPFDQFTIWQVAGDLLPEPTQDQLIASGFNRNHLLNGEGGAIPEEQRFNGLFDRMDTTATTWLGLTMACAQCHDHKYDPITQRDYYQLLDGFNRVPESGTPQRFSTRIRVGNPVLELPTAENEARIAELESQIGSLESEIKPLLELAFAAWRAGLAADGNDADASGLPETLVTLLKTPDDQRTQDEERAIADQLQKHFDEKVRATLGDQLPQLKHIEGVRKQLADYRADQIPRVMVMSDSKPRETHILDRGAYLSPLEQVAFSTPGFLPPLHADAPKNRLGLAQWLVAPENPLTARVQVNRMWQYYFGVGLVKTAEDFGVQSEYPVHKDLLDWLAVEFREGGWSMKHMHRLMVTSATYRQQSRVSPAMREADPENRLHARASRFRMPSMVLRDWALSASGLLETQVGGAPVYPYQPDAVWEALAITKERDFTYPSSAGRDLYRRSLYTFWRRTVSPANMFDASDRQTCRVRAATTSTPLHALTTLNDPTWIEAARALAANSMRAQSDLDAQLTYAFRQVVLRPLAADDATRLRRAFEKQLEIYQQDTTAAEQLLSVGSTARDTGLAADHHAALTAVCLAIFNLDEALTRE